MVSWDAVFHRLRDLPPHKEIWIAKSELPHPDRCAGFKRCMGFPKGQESDWRIVVDSRSIHVREYRDSFGIHRDRVHPDGAIGKIRHFMMDLPIVAVPSIVLAATGIYFLTKKRK